MNPALVEKTKFINTVRPICDLYRTLLSANGVEVPGKALNRQFVALAAALFVSGCGGGGGGGSKNGGGFSPPAAGNPVTVSGTVSYEFVPPNTGCNGLNFSATTERPVRAATVVLLDGNGAELARMPSSVTGAYEFSNVPANTNVRIRVLAESKISGAASWDIEVRDNVDTRPGAPPLGSRPMYSLESSVFNTGDSDVSLNLLARSGWDLAANRYTEPRAAAPFAILDTIYTGMQFIIEVDPDLVLPPLDVFWSVNNTASAFDRDEGDNNGEIGGSLYDFELDAMFVTGDENGDTDEFDAHVVGHEWTHFLDDAIFRSDSLGGTHRLGDKLDSRLAWSEGWPTALASMFLGSPSYCETGTPGTNAGFEINAEAGFFGGQGWFDEVGVVRFVYDLWDTTSEGTDFGSVGFAPIYEVMRNGQRTTPAWANIFTFAVELRALVDVNGDALIDSQLGDEMTVQGALLDIWGTNETNDGGAADPADVLPIYIDMVADGTTTNICSNSQFDTGAAKDGNKLSEYRYIRLSVPMLDEYNVVIESTTPTPPTPDMTDNDQSDPDMLLVQNGNAVLKLLSEDENFETGVTPPLQPGTYIADLRDWRYADPDISASYPPTVCFDVRFEPTP